MKAKFKFILVPAVLLGSFFLQSCGNEEKQEVQRIAKGNVEYGGVFRMNEVGDVRSLYPLDITEVASYRIANQIYEGLVKYNQATLEPIPALAESWSSNDEATEWTFNLRHGVKFHDDACFADGKGREVTAEDVEWCIKQLCTPDANNNMFWIAADRIKGARAFSESQKTNEPLDEIEGVEVLDDHTIKIALNFPTSNFLNILGHNGFYVFPKEAVDYYKQDLGTHAVGTGPFKVKAFKPNELAVLERNQDYYQVDQFGNQLPYLDAIEVTFVKDKKSELLMFKKGELDMVFTLPIEMYSGVMSDLNDANSGANVNFKPQVMPSLSVNFYAFQHQHPIFSDVNVRRAFNLAIDRKSLINYTLQGEGSPAVYGFVPPAFTDYDYKKIHGFDFDPIEARKLLTEAGFENGVGFPELTLEVSNGGSNYELVAQVIEKMLEENLNIKINIEMLPMGQQLDNAEDGNAAFWRDGWVADYPDPENFLCYFVSTDLPDANHERTYMNSGRYQNPVYDSLYLEAIKEIDFDLRQILYRKLDQMLVNDAVIMPIYYEEYTRLIPIYVQNFPQNSIEYRDFSAVWFKSELKEQH